MDNFRNLAMTSAPHGNQVKDPPVSSNVAIGHQPKKMEVFMGKYGKIIDKCGIFHGQVKKVPEGNS